MQHDYQLTSSSSPFLAEETHCIRILPGHNWPLWELSPRMSLWPPESEYACGVTLGRSYDSRTLIRKKGAQGRCGESFPRRGADGVVSMWADLLQHRKGELPLTAQKSSKRYRKRTLGHRFGERACDDGGTELSHDVLNPAHVPF